MLISSENENPAFTNFTVSLSNNKRLFPNYLVGLMGAPVRDPDGL